MAYVENMTIHDADSHVMEMPETILEFFEAKYRLNLNVLRRKNCAFHRNSKRWPLATTMRIFVLRRRLN